MRVLYFTKYSKLGASSRLRSFQFIPELEKKEIEISVQSLFSDNYLSALYNKKKSTPVYLLLGYIKRFFFLAKVFRYDLVVIEKELFPYCPAWIEILFNKLGIKYIVDYDDAIFHNYDLNSNFLIRKFLGNKIDLVMKFSSCVFAGNNYLAERAKRAGAKKIIILPTVIDTNKYIVNQIKDKNSFILGWIGSPSTFKYIEDLFPVFRNIKKSYPHFFVNIIGAKQNYDKVEDFISFIPWAETTEVDEINKFDLGIMPLFNTPWELGKCSYKLIQYMGCGIPILGSPVGMNTDVIIENYNGKIVEDGDWYNKIVFCLENKLNLGYMGINGRKLVDEKYNLSNNIKNIYNTFLDVYSKG